MIDNQVVDVSGIDQLLDMVHKFIEMAFFDRIEQGYFFVFDQEGIIGCSFVRGITMEVADIPVNGPHPEDFIFNFRGIHVFSLCNIYTSGLMYSTKKLNIKFNTTLKTIKAD
jgi:hypothetical protein